MGCSHSNTATSKNEAPPAAAAAPVAAAVAAAAPAAAAAASGKKAPKVVVVFYSTYGHCFAMAKAAVEGAAQAGATVELRRVQETLPVEVLEKMQAVEAQKAFASVPVAEPSELANFDAILIVTGTRFGLLPTQLRAFLDATGQLWMTGALTSKVGGAIVGSGTQHGGQETTFRALRNFFFSTKAWSSPGLHSPGLWASTRLRVGRRTVQRRSPGKVNDSPPRSSWRVPACRVRRSLATPQS